MTFISDLQTFVQGHLTHLTERYHLDEVWTKFCKRGDIYASDKEFTYSSVMILTFDKQTRSFFTKSILWVKYRSESIKWRLSEKVLQKNVSDGRPNGLTTIVLCENGLMIISSSSEGYLLYPWEKLYFDIDSYQMLLKNSVHNLDHIKYI